MRVHDTNSVYKELIGFPYKMHVFSKMQFVSHCYTVVSCSPIFRHSIYKNSAVYLSGAKILCFCMIRNLGSPTIRMFHDYVCRLVLLLLTSIQLQFDKRW